MHVCYKHIHARTHSHSCTHPHTHPHLYTKLGTPLSGRHLLRSALTLTAEYFPYIKTQRNSDVDTIYGKYHNIYSKHYFLCLEFAWGSVRKEEFVETETRLVHWGSTPWGHSTQSKAADKWDTFSVPCLLLQQWRWKYWQTFLLSCPWTWVTLLVTTDQFSSVVLVSLVPIDWFPNNCVLWVGTIATNLHNTTPHLNHI